jgi:hypothetical protein
MKWKNMNKVNTKYKLVCYEKSNECYLGNILCTEFIKNKKDAYDFSWMGIFRHIYLFCLRHEYPKYNFEWIQIVRIKDWKINIPVVTIKK